MRQTANGPFGAAITSPETAVLIVDRHLASYVPHSIVYAVVP